SVIIAHLSNPQTSKKEPVWVNLMNHFRQERCLDGVGNLQDLYMFLTRVALPNAIITNRRLLHELYMARRILPRNVRFRYDRWTLTYTPLTSLPLRPQPSHAVRPVMRSAPTPNGANFLQWLYEPLNTPPAHRPCPDQLLHRRTPLDGFLIEDEFIVRRVEPEALYQRTATVLSLFWWIECMSSDLRRYEATGWVGIGSELR
ncbi:hypothetical protein BU23DRAFT_452752, partial [Bimuria novae-zelandiae CBS 107.79]